MLILLHGPDTYRREAKRREIEAQFRTKHPMGQVIRVDCEDDASRATIASFTGTQSLFDPVAMVVLEHAYELEKKDLTALIAPHIESSSPVFLISEDTKPPKPFESLLKQAEPKSKTVLIQEFEHLEGAAWNTFVKKAAAEEEVVLTDAARASLAAQYEKDTWGLVTELQKLANLGKKEVDVGDIDGANLPEAPNFFALLGGLKSARVRDRLTMLERLLSAGEPAAKLFFILAYQGDNALRFAKYDFAVKSGKFEHEEALLDALL